MFTINPMTGNRDEIVIDASWGLGESVVSGKVGADNYRVDKRTMTILNRVIGSKELMVARMEDGVTKEIEVPMEKREIQALDDEDILDKLSRYDI